MEDMFTSFLQNVLEETSKIATSQFGKVSGTTKTGDSNQVLTQTDLEIGQNILAAIQKEFPEHNIIDEEAGVINKNSQYTWVVDPIDGTSNFANGVPMYGTMIGLLDGGQPIAAGLSLPEFKQIYLAEKGQGATCNGVPVYVTEQQDLLSCLVAYGIDGHQENPQMTYDECQTLADVVLGIRNLRSSNSVFDVAMLVQGKYGAALNRSSKIWDNVAQQILIEEAGGVYTDFNGQAMDYSNPLQRATQNFTYCAGSPTLHQQVQHLIHTKEK
jgi:myo-inositol-1(or 4)-monophosphatase